MDPSARSTSRRRFLISAAALVGGVAISACGPASSPASAPTAKPAETPKPAESKPAAAATPKPAAAPAQTQVVAAPSGLKESLEIGP